MKVLGRLASIEADKIRDARLKHRKLRKAEASKHDKAQGLQRSGSDLSKGRSGYNAKTKKWTMKPKAKK